MSISIKIDDFTNRDINLSKNFNISWEKYLLTIGIEIADIRIKKGDYYFTTRTI